MNITPGERLFDDIVDLCIKKLSGAHASFRISEVVGELGLHNFNFNWDHVVRVLEQQHKFSLIAVAEVFFRDRVWLKVQAFAEGDDETIKQLAGRYTATGHGKRTKGYALANLHGGRLLLYRVTVARNTANGIEERTKTKVKHNIGDPAIDANVGDALAKVVGIKRPAQVTVRKP